MTSTSTPKSWILKRQISTKDIIGPDPISNKQTSGGRAPWYVKNGSTHKKEKNVVLIGVAGGTASGKTSVCQAIVDELKLPWVQILSLDCFYKPLSKKDHDNVTDYNFDHPSAFDWDLLEEVLNQLKSGKAVKCPQYDFTTHSRKNDFTLMYGADVVLCEGILMLYVPKICDQFDVKVFVKTDDDIRLIRRIKRDIAERARSLESVLAQYQKTVKPSYSLFCEPTQSKADIVIPRGRSNVVAINLLVNHIKNKLFEAGNINPTFYRSSKNGMDPNMIPDNIEHLNSKNQLILNDKLNGKQLLDVVSSICTNLMTKCIEIFIPKRYKTPSPTNSSSTTPINEFYKLDKSLQVKSFDLDNDKLKENKKLKPSKSFDTSSIHEIGQFVPLQKSRKSVVTADEIDTKNNNQDHDEMNDNPSDSEEIIYYDDDDNIIDIQHINTDITNNKKDNNNNKEIVPICVVTVFSGGMLFGETVMKMLGNNKLFQVKYGSIHVFHETHKPSLPRFYDRKLPLNVNEQKVIVVDAFIGTGNKARMALQVLIDHHVPEQNICFITLMSSYAGIINLAKVFPGVQFITAQMSPKMGNKHNEDVPETSDLVLKYCKAAGIDIIDSEEIDINANAGTTGNDENNGKNQEEK